MDLVEDGAIYSMIKQKINEAIERDVFASMLRACSITEEEYYNQMNWNRTLSESFKSLADSFKEAQCIYTNESTIEQLKKQIKYSKNPMETKMLNKKLNQIYKEQKRRR